MTVKVLGQLLKEWMLPAEMKVSWDYGDYQAVAYAKKKFMEYLAEGWIAFSEEGSGRRQIFAFDSKLKRIVLIPPLGGG